VLMVFEDAHWIDPTSRELLDLTLDRVARLPVLLVVTFRPEFQHAWSGQQHVTTLILNRLGGRDGAALVTRLAGNADLSREAVDEIVERADGVPLFVEELTKAVLETGDRAATLAGRPSPAFSIPATLHASLMARLDRLGSLVKDTAQIGAVIGREFGYELIEKVAQRSAAELQTGLERLAEAGLLFCRGVAPESSYLFKHALVQDAAYGTLLRARRQDLHARVATALEQHFADLVERQPELLAHHLTAAGVTERAVDQWLKAGQHAAERSAHLDAIGHFEHGLETLAGVPQGPARDRREIELQLARGLSLLTGKGFTSVEAAEAFARARHLCETTGDANHLFVALWNTWMTTATRDTTAARPLSDKLLALTRNEQDTDHRLEAHHSAWFTHFYSGEPFSARSHCNEGRRLYDIDRHRSLAFRYGGHDAGVCAHNHGALSEWLLGYPDQALASVNDSVRLATLLAHPLSLNHTYYDTVIHLLRREPDIAVVRAHNAEQLAVEQRLALLINTDVLRGGALLAQGRVEEAAASVRVGRATRDSMGWHLYQPYQLALVSEVLGRAGDADGAAMALAEAQKVIESGNERWWEAEIHRLIGVQLLSQGKVAEGVSCFERAIGISRQQQAKSLELRAAMSLARVWGEEGRRIQARELLAAVYGWFTEGFDTADLKDAKALLAELG
jgi:predicted ATPase